MAIHQYVLPLQKLKNKNLYIALLVLLHVVFFSITIIACPYGCKQPQDNQNSWTQFFKVDKNRFSDSGVNPFFILKPGYFLILEGEEEGKTIKLIVTVLNKTKIIDDVKTRVVEEREFCNNELIEVSRNYFAIDTLTNSIFYFGEEVDIYEKGKIVSHEGAWQSGSNDARFGLMIPGVILLGARYYQEVAPGVAMDRGEILSMTETVETPAREFTNCLKIEETNPLEPEEKEYKYYSPGIGLVKDENLVLVEYGTQNK